MIDVRPVLYANGLLLLVLAAAMVPSAVVDLGYGHPDWPVFVASALVTGFAGLALMLGNRPRDAITLTTRQAFVLTVSVWVMASAFSSLPFLFSSIDMSLTDAFFEAMSGITASGSTVITGLDTLPHGILLWRAVMHWLGGIGIIVMALVLLPVLRIGGMQLFRMESSEKNEKVLPRASQIAAALLAVYAVLTAVCVLALYAAGMPFFDALCHGMSTLATGGFANSDSSIGVYGDPLIEWIIIFFMLVGGTTFVLFITPWRHNRWALLYDSQVGWYLAFTAFFSGLSAFWLWTVLDLPAAEALRSATFHVVSIVTTTGFAADDYNAWGGFGQVLFFMLSFVGGCTGSTAGGIKIFRYQVLFAMGVTQIKRLLHPHGVFVIDFNRQRVPDTIVRSVLGFAVLYLVTFALLSLALAATGLDMLTSLSGAATALGNVGPGLGDTIGPAGSFQPLPDLAKWLMSIGMLVGRLEVFTVIVLLLPQFWRR